MTFGDLKRLKVLLRQRLYPEKEIQTDDLFHEICRFLFDDNTYLSLWDEEVLNQTARLFEMKSPNPRVFAGQLDVLRRRTEFVRKANDLYFSVLSSKCSAEDIAHRLALLGIDEGNVIIDYARIENIRRSRSTVVEKLEAFNEYLAVGLGLQLGETEVALKQLVSSEKMFDAPGKGNALLLDRTHGCGVVTPLSISLAPGTGAVQCLVPSDREFPAAVKRARLCMVSNSFLGDSEGIAFSLETTSAEYSGNSIGLAAAAAIYSAAFGTSIDRYTAFTGDINLDGSNWRVCPVEAISAKLKAALQCGCRRVFIPKENQMDVDPNILEHLDIEYVDSVSDLILKLSPSIQTIQRDTTYAKKINCLMNYCRDRGWNLSEPENIQDGVQFVISPAAPPNFKVNLYLTGSHSPNTSNKTDFESLLVKLGTIDQPTIPIQPVNQTFVIKDNELRLQLKDQFSKLEPKTKPEQYCDYVFHFEKGEENLIVKQYSSGKLVFQGRAGAVYESLLNILISRYNLKYPQAHLSVGDYIKIDPVNIRPSQQSATVPELCVDFPYIGTDESGKGDYFGPLVIAGVWVDEAVNEKLRLIDVKDSKLLSDKRCRDLAGRIREICSGRFEEVELLPERYNELYEQFKKEGKNLNHLLAWGHARAIETILSKLPCPRAIADQFGDEKYILSKMMEKGRKVQLIQTPKAERYVAVATASILARDRFLARMDKLGQKYHTVLPRGASDSVVEVAKLIVRTSGVGELRSLAKLHHKTTQKIMEAKA
jgi:ribonuclease HIII